VVVEVGVTATSPREAPPAEADAADTLRVDALTAGALTSDALTAGALTSDALTAGGVAGDPSLALACLLRGRSWVALTGAGCSTESGIPDYRGAGARGRPRTSIQGPDFRASHAVRRRYWARAATGWDRIRSATPNAGHLALARLEAAAGLGGIITQNVDRLHHAAGSRAIVELHGALAEVRCLDCGLIHPRAEVQARLVEANRGWLERDVPAAPDGDADLPPDLVETFEVVGCAGCGGVLQPNVVFFGDGVPRPVVERAFAMLDAADVLVVLGTSLAVFSGYRFLLRAVDRSMPVAIVNLGPVRGEERATLKVEAPTGEVLPRLAGRLLSR
jgi:NAD-dependent SIR2 family protein deacetylase